MASKRSVPTASAPTAPTDDFKLINSVSGKMESRLHRAGITSYAELAALTPAQIAAQIGNPAGMLERITKENWTGQACELAELASQSETPAAEHSGPEAAANQRHETFAAELVMDAEDQVLHTRLMHVPSGDEERWEGWDDSRMIHFFAGRAGLQLPEPPRESVSEAIEAVAEATMEQSLAVPDESFSAPEPVSPEDILARVNEIRAKAVAAKSPSAATLASTDSEDAPARHALEVLAGDSKLPTRVLSHQQSFCVRLLLDGTKVATADPQPFLYTATVQARHLTDKTQTVLRGRGRIEFGETAVLDVTNISLPPGAYRLAAAVRLTPGGKYSSPVSDVNLRVEGGVLQVY